MALALRSSAAKLATCNRAGNSAVLKPTVLDASIGFAAETKADERDVAVPPSGLLAVVRGVAKQLVVR